VSIDDPITMSVSYSPTLCWELSTVM